MVVVDGGGNRGWEMEWAGHCARGEEREECDERSGGVRRREVLSAEQSWVGSGRTSHAGGGEGESLGIG